MIRTSLRLKVLLLAAANILLLMATLVWFARTQLQQNFAGLLLGESRERLTNLALDIARFV